MRIKIGSLLALLFGLIVVNSAGQSLHAVVALRSIDAATSQIVDKRVPSFITLGQLNADIGDVRIIQSSLLMAATADVDAIKQSLKKAQSHVTDDRARYEPLMVDQGDRDLYAEFSKDWASADAAWAKVLAAVDAGDHDKAMALLVGESRDAYEKAGAAIQAAVDDLKQNAIHEGAATRDTISTTGTATYIALAISIIIGLGAMAVGFSQVARPVVRMTSFMGMLATGDTTSEVPYSGRRDEVGAMAAAVKVFRDGMLHNKKLEREADAARARAEADRDRLTAEAGAAARARLQEATFGLASGLKRLAAGDLSFELSEPFAPDFEALRHDLNAAVAQLGETLHSVAQSAGSIDTGTREISQSSDDLSKRTEQQAASLEETAAALDQITVNVSNSSKRADEARAVAVQANTSAAQSGKVVANAVDAMQRIEQSSKQISNIIGVIDEIAFQTNLLALNAGVEAARAGEAGRGFAVVAQEVRELAQRSAKAAKEIKGLISNSTNEVESGVKLVRETGEVLKTIEQYVVTINHHMDSIATSAREQSTGLAEVNTAVNQMDQVTQQNAAMVEETNAASASLANEAGRLRELISQFNLGGRGNASSSVTTLRPAAPLTVAPVQINRDHKPAASPVRKMVADVARAYGKTAVAAQENWDEF
ncbi:methyl-accepting chemotaxis protein [Rhizobium leguminosarum]|uniref:methyl-accepting chemotaxis protein n=1 Tax=Rhizobium leguminosarum TaxID=384 RepID=UPI001C962EFF|nr:methyl-accepting chemotaxis protein [Rhizobium leguminosarum]MBY5460859.1 methyl-accepting chemotaxis protein [Rhizobium leguminosarum]